MRPFGSALCIALVLATGAMGADATLMVPQLVKPAATPVQGDPIQEKYDAAWSRYESSLAEVTESMNKTLDGLFNRAADAGNLDLASMWDEKKKLFADTKTLHWPTDGKSKGDWRKKFPDIEFPENFSEAVSAAQVGYAAAVKVLKTDYEALVREYTKERNLARAKQLKDELAALERKPAPPPERPKVDEPPEKPKTAVLFDGKTLKGWRLIRGEAQSKLPSPWSVDRVRGVLVATAGQHNWLETEDRYRNYTLRMDYRFLPDQKISGNGSGVVIGGRGVRPDGADPVGIEVNLTSPQSGYTGMLIAYACAMGRGGDRANPALDRFRLATTEAPRENHLGEWNALEIRNASGRLEVSVNGVIVNRADEVSQEPGTICLRTQDSYVEFRNITLMPMNPAGATR